MAERLSDVTSYAVRAELEDLLQRDLLGPWDGATEELPPDVQPSERYMIGRLVPRTNPGDVPPPAPSERDDPDQRQNVALDEDPDLVERETTGAASEGNEGDSDVESAQATRTGTMSASALGLSFRVPLDVHRLSVTVSWGRYATAASQHHTTETGRPKAVWTRTPAGGQHEVGLFEGVSDPLVLDADQPGVVLRTTVRERGACRVVDLALVNDQGADQRPVDAWRLFQASITVTALDGEAAVFVGHNDPEVGDLPSISDSERLSLALLYRRHRDYAHGRQCAVDAAVRDGESRAWRLTTTSFPAADVPLTVPGAPETMPGLVVDMARLGSQDLAREDLVAALTPLATGYRAWLAQQRARLDEAEIARYAPAGAHALERADGVADRLDRAIALLREDGQAREAFRFANQAMAMQRVRSELTRARTADPTARPADLLRRLDVPKQRSWRPFQLAFVLLCLPGLTDPRHVDAHRDVVGEAQLLFFPTGGGKTEAYLGLTAYTLAIRRLQGVVGTGDEVRDGSDGVAVLMRYTLRLLTAQQFQRAAALVCACELLRRERVASGEGRWGSTPFRVGLWVGSSVSPNTFEEAKRQVAESRGADDSLGGALQLAVCPWCGTRLSGASLKTDNARRRTLLLCPDAEGACPFTEAKSPGEGLPVLTVDEEVYRLTPSLVIGTVDKFAQLPWKAATATLFGLVDQRCPRHGWRNPDFDDFCTGVHQSRGALPSTKPEPTLRLRPPDLIIQDELHLIADALGSMVGLYETVIDDLCSRPVNGEAVRPVLVASTATVRRAREQVEQVFARDLCVFPPPVLDAGETFFSTVEPPSAENPSRRYRGICATGERLKAVEIRVAAAIMEHAQHLFDRYGAAADPYMTLVDYFTSTRELAGMRRLVEDDVTDRLASRQVRTNRRRPGLQELTSRMPSSRIASTLAELERTFDPVTDSTDGLEAFKRDVRAGAARAPAPERPPDVLLATSMLQVGVDVQRLGLMVVTGQPKNTAEYIQATSRVGRSRERPGLVVVVYHWSRPRDLAHYESFGYDHAAFGLRVEGLTTTPFSDRSMDRGLTALLAAQLRHGGIASLPNKAASQQPLNGPVVDRAVAVIRARAERVSHEPGRARKVGEALQHRLDRWYVRRQQLQTGVLGYEEKPDVNGLLNKPDDGDWDLWTAPMSLREVEPEVLLQLETRDTSLDDAPAWDYLPSGGER